MQEKDMVEWQKRVLEEQTELSVKMEKLKMFLGSNRSVLLGRNECRRLKMQYKVMGLYVDILEDRIVHFKKED